MANVRFEDNSIQVKGAIKKVCLNWLEEATAEIESQTKRNTRVKTGQTKGSFDHIVNESTMEGAVGSNYENAIWEEFGTGIYAENGDGRKTPWYYEDEHGETHKTQGKTGTRALRNAFDLLKNKVVSRLETMLKEME